MRISSNSDGGLVRGTGAGGTKGVGVVSIICSAQCPELVRPDQGVHAASCPAAFTYSRAGRGGCALRLPQSPRPSVLQMPHWHGNFGSGKMVWAAMLRVLAAIAFIVFS